MCVLILLAIGFSLTNYFMTNWGWISDSFMRGANEGYNMNKPPKTLTIDYLNLEPKDWAVFTDSVWNEKSQTWMPMQYQHLVVERPSQRPSYQTIFGFLVCFIMGCSFAIFFTFIKFIIAINRLDVFSWQNVSKLRFMGKAMLLVFLTNCVFEYLNYIEISSVVEVARYEFSKSDVVDYYSLFTGLGLLLIGEVFAIGLRLKEEQELTI